MLMSSDDGGVDHRVFLVRIVSQRLEKAMRKRGIVHKGSLTWILIFCKKFPGLLR